MSHHRHTMRDAIVDEQAKAAGWPVPEREVKFHPDRKWRADYWWYAGSQHPFQKATALEIEGGVWTRGRHTRGKGFVADMEKYNTMTAMGIRLIRLTPQQLGNGELETWLKKLAA